ncbi:hypothetical protein PFAG_04299 [Plasmodium falciparum Santa Lucia]|uniref:Uncharacterized protein n=13 Tax=Plasmodium falciparum TaxID=5833 RepID=C0H5A1_PLAF7|nr:conserved Plasmodium protein, unknown function [Plasmodium falciparum 3D7]ETW17069.1 hypothetical protein PFFVO_03898 [Plasmodium falciparum Vietnam Oak-Knoll (FVO)]ETW29629.1 hypothetical protein PFFCH_02899 [Plasmodium falciparum FCH/4]ETW35014.1 hypothetical protein PFTANZ_04267 [Plasmodium falciparum Tanzania (2000708)]ETW41216.1 hypothetical protein PFNF135_04457 [Plasmodium falciparum NF135/5.C10]ETW47748.1 hypothetical protein PFMALIP_04147 [Plasmodium falciparum MaliPS096_E11]ETW54|eukprot:XP_002808998.1 conserved Plasmodium protein, unknown function [Plasmodium falciparum 3D7]
MKLFNLLTKNVNCFKKLIEENKKSKNICHIFHGRNICTNVITQEQKPKVHLMTYDMDNNNVTKDFFINTFKNVNTYNVFNNTIYITDTIISKENDASRKLLYFKWKARKSYKKRVLNLPSTKSRRRYAQKNR